MTIERVCECCGSDEVVGVAPQSVMTEVSQAYGIKRMYPDHRTVQTCLACDKEMYRLHDLLGQARLAKLRGATKKPKKKGKS